MPALPHVLAVVFRDVVATFPLPVATGPSTFRDGIEGLWITTDGNSKAEILVDPALPAAEQLAAAADAVAEWLVECLPAADLPAVWPECPLHPGTHPLEARPGADTAQWTCPKSAKSVAAVGSLRPV